MKVLLTQSPEYIVFSINPDPLQTGQDEVGCEGFQISGGERPKDQDDVDWQFEDVIYGPPMYFRVFTLSAVHLSPKEIKRKVALCFLFYF